MSVNRGIRVPWAQAPAGFVAGLASHFGSPIVGAQDHPGGFSPGTAASVSFADGQRVFVKVVRNVPNETSVAIYRMEARSLQLLSGSALAPQLLWQAEGRERERIRWFGMAIEHVDGHHPAAPWHSDELAAVLDAIAQLGATPAAQAGPVPDVRRRLGRIFDYWGSASAAELVDLKDRTAGLWLADNLAALIRAEAGWREAAHGDRLVHGDLRSDNLLLSGSRVTFLDWPYAGSGAGWLDLVLMLPSMAMEGGVDPEQVTRSHPMTRSIPDADVDAVIAAMAGYFVRQSQQPDPPGLPTVRAFQRAQGAVAIDWLARRWG